MIVNSVLTNERQDSFNLQKMATRTLARLFMFLHGILCSLGLIIRNWVMRRGFRTLRRAGTRKRLPLPVLQRNRKKPLWVIHAVVRIKALCPDYGCTKVAHAFNRLYGHRSMSVSRSYVAYTIRNHRYAILQYRRAMRRRRAGRFRANRSWAIDLTGKQDAFGKVHMILGILDQGTRRGLCLKAIPNKCSWALLGHLFLAIARYGKPSALKSDNEAVFRSALFRAVLRFCGIRQQFSAIGCPWMNGRIERFFGTLKQSLNGWQVADAPMLQRALAQFLFFYNHVRPHENLGGQTPVEAWEKIDSYAEKPKQVRYFEAWEGLLTGFHIQR